MGIFAVLEGKNIAGALAQPPQYREKEIVGALVFWLAAAIEVCPAGLQQRIVVEGCSTAGLWSLCSTLAARAALVTNARSRTTQNKLAPSITTHH